MQEKREQGRIDKFIKDNKWLFSLACIIGAVVISWLIFVNSDKLKDFSRYGYIGIFLVVMAGNATIFLPMPGVYAVYLAGGIFNPLLVGIFAAAGGALGELTGYLAGLGGHTVISDKKIYNKIKAWIQRVGLIGVFLLASIPNPFFDMVGIAAGVMRIPILRFLLVTFFGQIVKYVLLSHLGLGFSKIVN